LRCLSLNADIEAGGASIDQATGDSVRLAMGANGKIDLGAETMALQLRPALRVPGNLAIVPLRAEGGGAEPRLVPGSAAPSAASPDGACTTTYAAAQPVPARRNQ